MNIIFNFAISCREGSFQGSKEGMGTALTAVVTAYKVSTRVPSL